MTDRKKVDLLAMIGDRMPGLRILDVGALFKPEVPIAYAPLLEDTRTTIIGFEPTDGECERLNVTFGQRHKFFPYAVGDGERASFYHCNHAMTSSLFEPDLEVMGWYQNLPEFCQVAGVSDLMTVRLDDVPEAIGADYLKLDVQGSEGTVLAGASSCLRSILAVHTEVEFVPIYARQPLFGDIDAMLRSCGFVLHRLVGLEGRTLRESGFQDCPGMRSQHLWADAVYIRPPRTWAGLTSPELLKLAAILHHVYGSIDFSARLLLMYDEREGTHFSRVYVDLMTN